MSEHERNSTELLGGCEPGAREGRKPYQKPAFRFEQVFETMALQCGKVAPTGGACNLVKMAS